MITAIRLLLLFGLLAPLARAGYRIENIPRPAEMRGGIIALGMRLQGKEGGGQRERQQAAVKAERRIRWDHDGSRYFSAASAGASGC